MNGETFSVPKIESYDSESLDETQKNSSTNNGVGVTKEVNILSGSLNNLFNLNISPKSNKGKSKKAPESSENNKEREI